MLDLAWPHLIFWVMAVC